MRVHRKLNKSIKIGENISEYDSYRAMSLAGVHTIRAINQSDWDSLDHVVETISATTLVDENTVINVVHGFVLVIDGCDKDTARKIHQAIRKLWPGYVRLRD